MMNRKIPTKSLRQKELYPLFRLSLIAFRKSLKALTRNEDFHLQYHQLIQPFPTRPAGKPENPVAEVFLVESECFHPIDVAISARRNMPPEPHDANPAYSIHRMHPGRPIVAQDETGWLIHAARANRQSKGEALLKYRD